MSTTERAKELRALCRMITDACEVVIGEWEADDQESSHGADTVSVLPSDALFEARRLIKGACGMCINLTEEPESRLTDIGLSFFLARALHVAIQARVADILADADPRDGLSSESISKGTGIDKQKLTRILRALCTVHVFKEVKHGRFTNSRVSQSLVHNEYLRCWILLHAAETYTASDMMLPFLFDPVKTHSTSPHVSPWQSATGSNLSFWEYIEQQAEEQDGTAGPEAASQSTYSLGMIGGGRTFGLALCTDYPWHSLGAGTVVDVGGGVGGTSLDLARSYPDLRFVVEDRPATVAQAEEIWQHEYPEAMVTGRVRLMSHDFFTDQPIKGAEVYLLRHILHDWPDDECVLILSRLRAVMSATSVVLVADKVMHTTAGSTHLKSAPPPLPPNYGSAHQARNMHDLVMMAVHNGMERTPEMFDELARRAGLRVSKTWECRSVNSIVEMKILAQ